jgi:hypothetical protein
VLEQYCQDDVTVLRQACQIFRRDCENRQHRHYSGESTLYKVSEFIQYYPRTSVCQGQEIRILRTVRKLYCKLRQVYSKSVSLHIISASEHRAVGTAT